MSYTATAIRFGKVRLDRGAGLRPVMLDLEELARAFAEAGIALPAPSVADPLPPVSSCGSWESQRRIIRERLRLEAEVEPGSAFPSICLEASS